MQHNHNHPSSASNSSIGSPPAPYHHSMQIQQHPSTDSANMLPHHSNPSHVNDYNQISQNAPSMYHNMHPTSDFGVIPSDSDISRQDKTHNYSAGPFSAGPSFNSFTNNRPRHGLSNVGPGVYREQPNSNFRQTFSGSNDLLGQSSYDQLAAIQSRSPPSLQSPFDALHNQGRASYDLAGPLSAGAAGPQRSRQTYTNMDAFGPGLGSSMIQSGNKLPNGAVQAQPRSFQSGPQYNSSMHSMQSQTPFGPHLPANGVSTPSTSTITAPTVTHVNGAGQTPQQEEISTIFVVGFPDDMQEREFQNMFTFSPGFEAATLKIPNKELTAYGSGAGPMRPSYSQGYSGQNDPYNLVTVNQGGVLVDGGRDGTTASWPAAPVDDGHYLQTAGATMPPRKQIIGFAKFSTRAEAQAARDVLQGRRVDAEKGAVLKAEMAKKNLHTKRGVGQSGLPGVGGMPADLINGLSNMPSGGEALSVRERELGALGAMGLNGRRMMNDEDMERTQRRERDLAGMMAALSPYGTRGPRERAEEEDRRKSRENMRLRSANASAFDAFHSVAPSLLHNDESMLNGISDGLSTNGASNPWTMPLRETGIMSAGTTRRNMPFGYQQRPTSPSQSPPNPEAFPSSASQSASSQSGRSDFDTLGDAGHMSPPAEYYLPMGFQSRSRARSPSIDSQPSQSAILPGGQTGTISDSSSFSGSQAGGAELEVSYALQDLAMNRQQGNASPQLPSPASNASSGTRANAGDQNPPINTLYVGNLPTSPTQAGYPTSHLEDSLRDLFSRQPGFRKLCFRQKSNGPMCFVEFEDVSFAARALNELYGNTLNGMVKGGGIRLSYSKNPLGVRTPTSATQVATPPAAFPPEAFAPRHSSVMVDIDVTPRRNDPTSMSYQYAMGTPPRFASPFGTQALPPSFPRASAPAFNPAAGLSNSFSPFVTSSPRQIPPERSSADQSDHLVSSLSPLATATTT